METEITAQEKLEKAKRLLIKYFKELHFKSAIVSPDEIISNPDMYRLYGYLRSLVDLGYVLRPEYDKLFNVILYSTMGDYERDIKAVKLNAQPQTKTDLKRILMCLGGSETEVSCKTYHSCTGDCKSCNKNKNHNKKCSDIIEVD